MLAPDMECAGPSGCGWSISSRHTLTRADHTADKSEVRSPEPEVDEIDDLVFMSFETLEDIEKYTLADQNKRKDANPVVSKKVDTVSATTGQSVQPSSAFMSPSLDQFLQQTFDELKRKPAVRRLASSPPRDSRIFETGALQMDIRPEMVRKPFADLPKLTPVRDGATAVSRNSSSGVENQPIVQKAPVENSVLKKRTDTLLVDFDPDKIGPDLREKTFARVVSEAAKERILSRKSRHVSLLMDERYSHFAVEAVLSSPGPLPEPPKKKVKKSHKKWNDDSYSPPKSSKDTDLVAMISRKRDSAKRDIRLPSRYQESALIEGNQFICAAPFGSEHHVHDKKSSKRLIDEQKRLQVVKHPSSKPMPHADLDPRPVPQKSILKKTAAISVRPVLIPVTRAPSLTKETVTPAVAQSSKLTASGSRHVTALPVAPIDSIPSEKPPAAGNAVMKQLYRELFFECSPDRRAFFHKKGIKPRVHKQQQVEEAIEVIRRLEMREKQLLYIKKLLSLWHRKLDLCSQVVSHKIRLEPNQTKDTVTVVTSVLHAYQTSVCYKISAIAEKQLRSSSESAPCQPSDPYSCSFSQSPKMPITPAKRRTCLRGQQK